MDQVNFSSIPIRFIVTYCCHLAAVQADISLMESVVQCFSVVCAPPFCLFHHRRIAPSSPLRRRRRPLLVDTLLQCMLGQVFNDPLQCSSIIISGCGGVETKNNGNSRQIRRHQEEYQFLMPQKGQVQMDMGLCGV